ncbi:MAG: VWA domain-containing protein [Planctomycetaceae bacterium]|jgi:Mg-chelatase subunit ChlD|nr:VWA domain-containing protein [Planctomycetaceae bacterium]
MIFQQPIWFLLLLPLACMVYYWRMPSRFLVVLRALILISIVLAMVGLTIKLPTRSGTIIVIADRSRSMPSESDIAEKHAINLLLNHIGREDRLGVVSFGMSPMVERVPSDSSTGEFNEFHNSGNLDASNLHDAIDQALSLIPNGEKSRLLIISDGRWTGESPDLLISRLVQRGIAVDYRLIERSHVGDVAVLSIDAPERVLPGEIFKITGMIYVPVAQNVEYELVCNGVKAASGIRSMDAGSNRIDFMLKAGVPGTMQCDLSVKSVIDDAHENSDPNNNGNDNVDSADSDSVSDSKKSKSKGTFAKDPVPENNFARRLVGVEGDKPLLVLVPQVVSGGGRVGTRSRLAEVLRNAALNVEVSDGVGISWSLATLSRYSGIILDNVPAAQIGSRGMELMREWVKETGAGLMFTGGKNAYALGGYYKSAIDPIMPVSMEIRKEHRKLAIAVAVLMDCSGSMGMMVAGNKIKMDLADAGAAEVLRILSPMDEVAVYTCDTGVQTIIPLKPNTSPNVDIKKILSVGPGGGGIFVYTGLKRVTAELAKATPETKHIILFTDAADTEEPGDYVRLLTACLELGMTCSVIALGTEADSTADFCKDIARVGGGNIYFTEMAEELPRLFAQDTFTISRSTFLEDETPFHFSGGMLTLSDVMFKNPLALGGYNLCYLKDKAILSAVTDDEYNSPIIASWQAGLGRVLCYMGQVDGKFTGAIAKWENYNLMLSSLGRWTAGKANLLPNNMMLTQTLENGSCRINLHLDPESDNVIMTTPEVSVLVQRSDGAVESRKVLLKWTDPDLLGATIPLAGDEIVQATLLLSDGGETKTFPLPPICIPNSPEFKPPDRFRESGDMLRQLAVSTGGIERIELPRIWKDIPKTPRFFDLSTWLIYFAIFCVVVEIFQRRTGLVTAWSNRIIARFRQVKLVQEKNKNENEAVNSNNENNNDNDDNKDNAQGKTLSIFQRLKLRKKAREIIKSDGETENSKSLSNRETVNQSNSDQLPKMQDQSSSPDQSDVLDALTKAKRLSKSRTKK